MIIVFKLSFTVYIHSLSPTAGLQHWKSGQPAIPDELVTGSLGHELMLSEKL